MKRMLAALLLCGATLSTTMTSAHDSDFPNQLRAINVCYTQWSTQHPGKAMTEAQLVACMKAQGFRFDPNRQIKGVGPCHGNKTAADHPDCYAEPPKTRANRARPTRGAARVPGYLFRVGGALTDCPARSGPVQLVTFAAAKPSKPSNQSQNGLASVASR